MASMSIWLVFIVPTLSSTVFGTEETLCELKHFRELLDNNHDVFNWKISNEWFHYMDKGTDLKAHSSHFIPKGVETDSLKGLWLLRRQVNETRLKWTDHVSSPFFEYSGSHQLYGSVTISALLTGDAYISISTDTNLEDYITIKNECEDKPAIRNYRVMLNGKSHFLLEFHANSKEDTILLDRITACILEYPSGKGPPAPDSEGLIKLNLLPTQC